jgi:hypothetical protein
MATYSVDLWESPLKDGEVDAFLNFTSKNEDLWENRNSDSYITIAPQNQENILTSLARKIRIIANNESYLPNTNPESPAKAIDLMRDNETYFNTDESSAEAMKIMYNNESYLR